MLPSTANASTRFTQICVSITTFISGICEHEHLLLHSAHATRIDTRGGDDGPSLSCSFLPSFSRLTSPSQSGPGPGASSSGTGASGSGAGGSGPGAGTSGSGAGESGPGAGTSGPGTGGSGSGAGPSPS